MSIVVEVRDGGSRAKGRKAISADMAEKLAQRGANAGIYLSRTQDGLSLREIGEWAEGASDRGTWVACTQHYVASLEQQDQDLQWNAFQFQPMTTAGLTCGQ
jgi:hypothetical protein